MIRDDTITFINSLSVRGEARRQTEGRTDGRTSPTEDCCVAVSRSGRMTHRAHFGSRHGRLTHKGSGQPAECKCGMKLSKNTLVERGVCQARYPNLSRRGNTSLEE